MSGSLNNPQETFKKRENMRTAKNRFFFNQYPMLVNEKSPKRIYNSFSSNKKLFRLFVTETDKITGIISPINYSPS